MTKKTILAISVFSLVLTGCTGANINTKVDSINIPVDVTVPVGNDAIEMFAPKKTKKK